MNEFESYIVGGAVRDQLLGLTVKDFDWVVVGATPEQLTAAGYKPVGKDFPVFLHPQTHEEYALARTERKTAPGYRGFAVNAAPEVSLEDDLRRRDLTINAIARDRAGRLIDPYGGAADLRERWLRHVSPAFAEDPVRVLRVARFAARYHGLGFRVAPETAALMRAMVDSGEVDALVAERVWAETAKALAEPHPERYLEVLRDCGALARVFPELDALFGVPQTLRHHPEVDAGRHLLLCLRQAVKLGADLQTRFAVLVHDLGKGTTPVAVWPKHTEHELRGVELCKTFCRRLRVPNEYRDLGVLTSRYHLHCHRALELRPGKILTLLETADALRRPDRFRRFLLACEADAKGRLGLEQRPYPQADYLDRARMAAAAVDVKTLLARGLSGAEIGTELRRLRLDALTALRRPTPG